MKTEINLWIEMARDDLDSAKVNFDNKKYYVCAYLSQQAVEKALKAMLIKKFKEIIKTHDLIFLAKKAGLSQDFIAKCELLNGIYIETKYGSLDNEIPSKKFNKVNSEEYFNTAKEIASWITKNIWLS